MSIFEILEYGPIVAWSEEFGILITVNGSYLNLWMTDGKDFMNTDCRSMGYPNGLYGMDITKVMKDAEEYLTDCLKESEEE
jgi:hypothetical protein